ncbi:MAG: 30S ribosomal protein S6 [Candidatus Omnitrophica bacterium]|nr:30S ribosomal protein S6 [Candidatus Omnitrophota bacterium]
MHRYEAMMILRPELSEDQMKQLVARIEDALVKSGGQIESSQAWGRRRLAYPIAKSREGVYHLIVFRVEPAAIERLRKSYRLDEQILRALIVRQDHQPAPVTAAA